MPSNSILMMYFIQGSIKHEILHTKDFNEFTSHISSPVGDLDFIVFLSSNGQTYPDGKRNANYLNFPKYKTRTNSIVNLCACVD